MKYRIVDGQVRETDGFPVENWYDEYSEENSYGALRVYREPYSSRAKFVLTIFNRTSLFYAWTDVDIFETVKFLRTLGFMERK